MLASLVAAHEKGIVHRDIKPQNIFLKKLANGISQARVLDFGIAKVMNSEASALTQTGAAVGTALYMAPEQATAQKDLDARADVWAVGVVLYEMLTGEAPFMAPTLSAVIAKIVTEDPPSLTAKNPEVTEELDALVRRALARDRSARIPSAEAFLEELGRVSMGLRPTERGFSATPPAPSNPMRSAPPVARTSDAMRSVPPSSPRRWWAFAAIGGTLSVAIVVWYAQTQRGPGVTRDLPASASAEGPIPVSIPTASSTEAPAETASARSQTSASPTALVAPSASAVPVSRVRPLACGPHEQASEGHCCPKGLKWSKLLGRCERPLATSL